MISKSSGRKLNPELYQSIVTPTPNQPAILSAIIFVAQMPRLAKIDSSPPKNVVQLLDFRSTLP